MKGANYSDSVKLTLTVNLASSLIHAGQKERGLAILAKVDWTASADNFAICVAALRSELSKVVSLMPSVSSEEKIGKDGFRHWPVFDYVRQEKEFRDEFRRIFSEDVIDPKNEDSGPLPSPPSVEKKKAEESVPCADEKSASVH